MKRLLVLFLSICILMTVLVGCAQDAKEITETEVKEEAKEDSDEEVIELTFWCHENEPWKIAYEKMAAKFHEANPKYKVKVESYPFNIYVNKIQTALTGGTGGPDIIAVWGGMAPAYIQSDGIEEVPADLVAEFESDYLAPSLGIYKKAGAYYGVPIESNLEYGGMIVNKKMLEEAGKEYPQTWEELRKLSDELSISNAAVVEKAGFQMTDTDSLICNYLAMILQQGGQYIQEDGSVNFATPEGVKALEEILSTVDNGESDVENLVNGEYSFHNVYRGNAYMASAGSWAVGEAAAYDLELGTDFDYVPVPQYGDQMAFAAETGWGVIVPRNSGNIEGAWEFVRFFSQPENLVEHNIACNQLPPRESLLDNEKYISEMPHIAFLLDILPYGQWMGPYNTSLLRDSFYDMFIELSSMSPAERNIQKALEDVSKEISETAMIDYSAE